MPCVIRLYYLIWFQDEASTVRKIVTDGLPPFRPILSAIGTPTYALAKFLVPMLEPLTTNEYTVKDSFTFAEKFQF